MSEALSGGMGPGGMGPDAKPSGPVTLGDKGALREEALVRRRPSETERSERDTLAEGRTEAELRDVALRGEARRKERFREVFEWLIVIGMAAVGFALLAAGIAYIAHLILPEESHWLTDDQQEDLRNILTGGFAALIASQIKKRLD